MDTNKKIGIIFLDQLFEQALSNDFLVVELCPILN